MPLREKETPDRTLRIGQQFRLLVDLKSGPAGAVVLGPRRVAMFGEGNNFIGKSRRYRLTFGRIAREHICSG